MPQEIDIDTPLRTILAAIVLGCNKRKPHTAATMLGIGRNALSRVLNGHASLSISLAVKIEDVFGYSALALLRHQVSRDFVKYRAEIGSTILPVLRKGNFNAQ